MVKGTVKQNLTDKMSARYDTKPYANIANNATTDQSGWMTAAFFSSA